MMKCFLPLVSRPVQLTYFLSQRLAWPWSNKSCTKCPQNHLLTCHSFLVQHSLVQGRRDDSDESCGKAARPPRRFWHTLSLLTLCLEMSKLSSETDAPTRLISKECVTTRQQEPYEMSMGVSCPGSKMSWFQWFILAGRVLMVVSLKKPVLAQPVPCCQ